MSDITLHDSTVNIVKLLNRNYLFPKITLSIVIPVQTGISLNSNLSIRKWRKRFLSAREWRWREWTFLLYFNI